GKWSHCSEEYALNTTFLSFVRAVRRKAVFGSAKVNRNSPQTAGGHDALPGTCSDSRSGSEYRSGFGIRRLKSINEGKRPEHRCVEAERGEVEIRPRSSAQKPAGKS